MRRLAGAAASWLVAVGLQLSGWIQPQLAAAMLILAVAISAGLAVTAPAFRSRLTLRGRKKPAKAEALRFSGVEVVKDHVLEWVYAAENRTLKLPVLLLRATLENVTADHRVLEGTSLTLEASEPNLPGLWPVTLHRKHDNRRPYSLTHRLNPGRSIEFDVLSRSRVSMVQASFIYRSDLHQSQECWWQVPDDMFESWDRALHGSGLYVKLVARADPDVTAEQWFSVKYDASRYELTVTPAEPPEVERESHPPAPTISLQPVSGDSFGIEVTNAGETRVFEAQIQIVDGQDSIHGVTRPPLPTYAGYWELGAGPVARLPQGHKDFLLLGLREFEFPFVTFRMAFYDRAAQKRLDYGTTSWLVLDPNIAAVHLELRVTISSTPSLPEGPFSAVYVVDGHADPLLRQRT